MQISRFTKPELDYLKENCNFVNLEIDIFEMRSKGYTLQEIAENLNISIEWCRTLSRRINKKIDKVLS